MEGSLTLDIRGQMLEEARMLCEESEFHGVVR